MAQNRTNFPKIFFNLMKCQHHLDNLLMEGPSIFLKAKFEGNQIYAISSTLDIENQLRDISARALRFKANESHAVLVAHYGHTVQSIIDQVTHHSSNIGSLDDLLEPWNTAIMWAKKRNFRKYPDTLIRDLWLKIQGAHDNRMQNPGGMSPPRQETTISIDSSTKSDTSETSVDWSVQEPKDDSVAELNPIPDTRQQPERIDLSMDLTNVSQQPIPSTSEILLPSLSSHQPVREQPILPTHPGWTAVCGPANIMSNFAPTPLIENSTTYPTAEHLYQCRKVAHMGLSHLIPQLLATKKAHQAKALSDQHLKGHKGKALMVNPFYRHKMDSWKEVGSRICVRSILDKKYNQCREFRRQLEETWDTYIFHPVPDKYFGTGDRSHDNPLGTGGHNVFGHELMACRQRHLGLPITDPPTKQEIEEQNNQNQANLEAAPMFNVTGRGVDMAAQADDWTQARSPKHNIESTSTERPEPHHGQQKEHRPQKPTLKRALFRDTTPDEPQHKRPKSHTLTATKKKTHDPVPLMNIVAVPSTSQWNTSSHHADHRINTPKESRTASIRSYLSTPENPQHDVTRETQNDQEWVRIYPEVAPRVSSQAMKSSSWPAPLNSTTVTIIGDSNLDRITHIPRAFAPITSILAYPGMRVEHLRPILNRRHKDYTTCKAIIFAAGINNRQQNWQKTVKKNALSAIKGIKQAFPNATIFFPDLPQNPSDQERLNLTQIERGMAAAGCITLSALADLNIKHDKVHLTNESANRLLAHWLALVDSILNILPKN